MRAALRGVLLLAALATAACGAAEAPGPPPPPTPGSVAVGTELTQADLARVLAEGDADLVVAAVFIPD